MTVLAPPLPSLDCAQLHTLLQQSQKVAIERDQPQIVSFSQTIPPVDPYQVMTQMGRPGEPLLSYGRSSQICPGSLLVAGGKVRQLTLQGPHRFSQGKQQIQQILSQCHRLGLAHHPLASPRILCSFSFFPTVPQEGPFPAATLLLPEWLIGHHNGDWIAVVNQSITAETNLNQLVQQITQTLAQITSVSPTSDPWSSLPWDNSPVCLDTRKLKHSIRSVLGQIHQHHIEKVVLSHRLTLPLSQPLPVPPLLGRLHQIYPDCTVFSFTLGGDSPTFLGASPERLVSLNHDHFRIDALAGSAPRGQTRIQDQILSQSLLASPKDRHEHHLVVSSILQQLKSLGLEVTPASTPVLLKLPRIQHLHTPIQGQIVSGLTPLDLVAALHPTPAVAGTPTSLACDQIRQWEPFDRSLYAAPLGWIDGQGNGEFIVGIRSAILSTQHLQLFAGAGIVKDSDPDREIAEVELKLGTLLQALTPEAHGSRLP